MRLSEVMRTIEVGRRPPTAVLGAAAIAAVALFGAVALYLAAGGAQAPVIAPPAVSVAPTGSPSATAVIVHVAGRVASPGVYELPVGSRVADAIEAAGGPLRDAAVDALNLAEVLVDGARIEVPGRGASPVDAVPAPASSGAPVVGLNAADQAQLESIPGIGPVTASAILAHRAEIGGFTSLEQLLEVSGIGPATFESIRPYVTL
jgi:competence protein ComEA